MSAPTILSKESLVPLGLVITLVGAAISFGVMYQKVEEVRGDVSEMKAQVSRIDDKLDALAQRSVASN